MNTDIRFGPAGTPTISKGGTLDGLRVTAELRLRAYEVEFVRGVKMGRKMAVEVGGLAKKLGISLSAHAPYWINCCAKEQGKINATIRNILETARAMELLGGGVMVFHPGFYMGRDPKLCAKIAKKTLGQALEKMKKENINKVILGPETMGKVSQYGNLEECIDLAQSLPKTVPVVDFGHLHARGNGAIKGKDDYKKIFDALEKGVGSGYVRKFHSHFSEIEYTEKGERRHIELGSNSPPFKPLAEVIVENGYSGTIISESPLLEQDALKMKRIYTQLLEKGKH